MCTVTLIPTQENDFILTSNRDEAIDRKTLLPEFYKVDGTRMLFPKDALAGGTWIGVSDQDTLICLLNGGFVKHQRARSYRQSRGVVVKDLLAAPDLLSAIEEYNYEGIEPFTIVAATWKSALAFYELVWDGVQKHVTQLDRQTYIWSSSTLYTPEMKSTRTHWFRTYEQEQALTAASLLEFHKHAGVGDKQIDLQIDRGVLKTRSITQVSKTEDTLTMRYEDLKNDRIHTVVFDEVTVN